MYIAKGPMKDSQPNSPEQHSRRSKIKALTTLGVRGCRYVVRLFFGIGSFAFSGFEEGRGCCFGVVGS